MFLRIVLILIICICYLSLIVYLYKHSTNKSSYLTYLKTKRDNLKLKIYFEEDNIKAKEELKWVENEIMNLEG